MGGKMDDSQEVGEVQAKRSSRCEDDEVERPKGSTQQRCSDWRMWRLQ